MLGRVEVATTFTLNGGAAPTTFALGLVTGAVLNFYVEEEGMFVDLTAKVTYANSVVEGADFTIFVDGADVANGTNGLARHEPAAAADINTVIASRCVSLTKGFHTAVIRAKAPTGVVTISGAVIPCELVAFRNSNNSLLAHGAESKSLFVQ